MDEDDPHRPLVEAVQRGECPDCGHPSLPGQIPEWLGLVPELALPEALSGVGCERWTGHQAVRGDDGRGGYSGVSGGVRESKLGLYSRTPVRFRCS